MKVDSLQAVFEDQLKDLYSAENQLLKALPKLAKKAGEGNAWTLTNA
jgi:ferritin-like metal-binding protein YciE